ncbi:DinQ-like type I toxin DqlB [Klebsiella pneumoniae]
MINLLIVVLRAVVAVSNAVIAVLELIRQYFGVVSENGK